jgi:tetratricopeptide (TPR) repeat protein
VLQADRVDAPAFVAHRFRLDRSLGRGGSGEVHMAFDLLTERAVALKLLRADRADPDVEDGLRAEFRALRSLLHPGIVRVFDFGRAGGAPFYTMELLDGRDLAASRDGVDAHAFVEQTARTLDYLHANGLVHSDLKPSNVFRVGPRFVLTDFGLVQRARGARRDAPYGTLAYMPPERLRGGDPDPREDLYALGAILYEILVGRAPYARGTPDATVAAILAADLDSELAPAPEPWTRLLRRLLAPEPLSRFATAWDLLQTWSALFDRPAPAPPAWAPQFVGRRRELGAVRAAAAELARARGAFVHVRGLPGVGKSALLDAASGQVAAGGLPCWRFDAPAAPRPMALVEALAALYQRWAPALPPGACDAALRLADWPRALTAAVGDEGVLNAHAHALADLSALAGDVPHALVLDDAHRLDHASRALLRFLAANANDLGILWLVGARSERDDDEFADALRQLRQSGAAVQPIMLRELGGDEVATLVQRRFGTSGELDALAERILALTHGHPFFVNEALQHLVQTGQLRRQTLGWDVSPHAARKLLPRVADTILSDHIGAAREADRLTYEVLALFPSGATPPVLARVLETHADDVRGSLARGVKSGLLAETEDVFRFAHDLIREACAERCPPSSARRHHRAIADVVTGTPAEAHHRLAAEDATPAARECYLREARAYEARAAPWEALRLYEAALAIDPEDEAAEDLALRVAELRTQVGQFDEAAALLLQRLVAVRRPLARARYLHRLGDTYGKQGRNAEALPHMQAAAELFRDHAEAVEQRRFAVDLVRVLLAKGELEAAIATGAETLATVPADAPVERAQLLLLQAQAQRQSGDYAGAEATCRTALELLKPLGRTRELAQTYTQIGTCYFYRREYDQAERFYRTALKVHTEMGDLHGMCAVHNNLGMALFRADRLEEAIVAHEKSLEIKRRLGDRPGVGSSLNNLGNLWERRGDFRRALQCYRRGVSIYRRLHRPRELATLYNNMTEVYLNLGRFHAAVRVLRRAERQAASVPSSYIAQMVTYNTADAHIGLMEPQRAIACLSAALPAARQSGLRDVLVRFHGRLSLAYAMAGDPMQSGVHDRLARDALSAGAEVDAQLDAGLDLGEAALLCARLDEAERMLADALATAQANERSWPTARALRLLAASDHRRGHWDRAETRLEAAAGICRTMGFRSELAKCYMLLGSIHWEVGLRARAEEDFERSARLLEELDLRTELGLAYLQRARLTATRSD